MEEKLQSNQGCLWKVQALSVVVPADGLENSGECAYFSDVNPVQVCVCAEMVNDVL